VASTRTPGPTDATLPAPGKATRGETWVRVDAPGPNDRHRSDDSTRAHRLRPESTQRADSSALDDRSQARATDSKPDDLQAACQRAIHGLCEELGLDVGLVVQRGNETTRVRPLASFARAGVPETPEAGELALLWRMTRASDLGDPTHPELASGLARRTGFTAARAVSAPGAIRALAPGGLLLLVGGEHDPVGRVRPLTLARLDAVATRLQAPLEQARTFSRIAELDDAVKRLDRLALLGSLMAEVIHEVRNPMVSIKTFLELLPDRLDDPEFHDEFRTLVLQEVFRLERLLDHVLAHARPGPTHQRPEDAQIAEALAGLEQLLSHRAREAGVHLTAVALEEDLGAAALSPDALRQVLLNLCVNAIEACSEGGAVRVTARRRSQGGSATSLEIWVEDDGPGISEADRELVFEPFHTQRSDAPGGLGLAISRRLAEEAGGRLFVAQAADGGARFVLRLPAAD
jgi:signal transduction histidine kinase